MNWDDDKKLKKLKERDLDIDILEEYVIFETEVLEYRKSLPEQMDTPKIYFNSIDQIEKRLSWLKSQIQIKKTKLYKLFDK